MSLFRFCVSVQLLSRPLVAGACWSLVTGSWSTGLGVAFFFELLWLDCIPVGTFIPPASLFSTIASLTLVHVLGLQHPSEIFMVLVATTPFASFMSWLEARQRMWQNREFNLLVVATRRGNASLFAPEKFIRKGIVHTFLIQAVACLGILALLHVLLGYALEHVHIVPWVSWPILWLIASLGGVIAMRFRNAHLYMLGGIGLVELVLWSGFFV
ncbi:PTS sugar transporter subunit IIC [Desulfoplanes formicivorans]|uniref:Uncharacterized protein n=1 Tax=Desulfoplanes formicivorans TaxID=1592317 RepID=A0A194AJV0_9BACT|nr:PTS sugar transporter subunit IIC [Desulfoplanes formicivorans]GAU09004.1 hypothetical protein DPF_1723 [Desulfoplanes formicivorans]